MHKSLLDDLQTADKFIFMEYFIIEEGVFWNSILEVLKQKAEQGVDVRVVYDDIGCMMTLPGNYTKILQRYGIKATPFSRLKGNADNEFNNRNHRKITVIDGKIGYTGGINLADEYINAVEKFGHWKDSGLRLQGQAVWELTQLFLTDYGMNYKHYEDENRAEFFPPCAEDESGYVIPFGDGPTVYKRRVGKSVIINMLAAANEYVYITSPYLIIDNELCTAIENAALRSVNVKIIVPHIPDKKSVFTVTKSFYYRLISAGVEIFEYTPGFIHAKSYLVDGKYAMIGTINLDYRSLAHHFENGVWMYRCKSIDDLRTDIIATLAKCERMQAHKNVNIFYRMFCSLIKIFSPLL